MLGDGKMRELLRNGFPAALHFRLELWQAGGVFDEIESTTQWDVLVHYDAYNQLYRVVRRQGSAIEDFGGFATLEAAEAVIERYPVALPPRRAGTRYYY